MLSYEAWTDGHTAVCHNKPVFWRAYKSEWPISWNYEYIIFGQIIFQNFHQLSDYRTVGLSDCRNQNEDEKHFLLHCKQFNTQRNIFNEKILNILENASYKNANNKISFLFNNKSYSILRLTSSFISNHLQFDLIYIINNTSLF
jgi:hypothetical protein